jgi:hypothetical protein
VPDEGEFWLYRYLTNEEMSAVKLPADPAVLARLSTLSVSGGLRMATCFQVISGVVGSDKIGLRA